MKKASHFKSYRDWITGGALICGLIVTLVLNTSSSMFAQDSVAAAPNSIAAFDTPTNSSPVAMSQDKSLIWSVNPDDGSVSVLGDLDGTPHMLKKISGVGREPQGVALDTGNHAYVVSPPDNGVTVIEITSANVNSFNAVVEKKLTTGAEPWNIVASPDGKRVFVANSGQDTITVIRTDTRTVVGNVELNNSICNVGDQNRHFQPRGLAVTLDNSRLYVTRFLSFTKPGGTQAVDEGKEGVVCQLNIPVDLATLPTVANVVKLAAQDTGFKIDKNKDNIADPTFAYPNQLQSVVIRDNQAYLPNIAASTTGPLKFNVDTQAFVNVIDNAASGSPADSPTKSINMHLGARVPEAGKKKLFFANPWAIAFTNQSGAGKAYAVSAGSDLLVKLEVDATGDLNFTGGVSTTRYIDLNDPATVETAGANGGKNPLGLVIRANKAFVMNYVSRNVSVVNLDTDKVETVIKTTDLPTANTFDEQLLVGKEQFFSSRGHYDRPPGTTVSTDERLSSEGWQNCASCHFAGLTDGNVWDFTTGPRKSVPLNATWSPHNPNDQRLLNYSAIFDEVQDFEINARNVSGPGPLTAQQKPAVACAFLPAPAAPNTVGTTPTFDPNHGLIFGDDGNINNAPCTVVGFAKPNAGRPQVTVTLPGSNKAWPALDSLKEWVRFSIRTPEGVLTTDQLTAGNGNATGGLDANTVKQGRKLFFQAGCQKCHGGTKWTISNKDFVAPPAAADINTEAPVTSTIGAQYLNRFLSDIGSFNLNVAGASNTLIGQPEIGGVEKTDVGLGALGKDVNGDGKGNGYNIPALLGIWALPPYYHNGACETLNCVLTNVKHRTSGLRQGQSDPFTDPNKQAAIVTWLKTLDADTPFPLNLIVNQHDIFIDPPTVFKGSQVVVGANISLFGTKADLADLITDLGLPGLTVRVALDPSDSAASVDLTIPASAFNQDFGQAVITTTWKIPANPSSTFGKITVTVDPDDKLTEDKESDNSASRQVRLRNQPSDNTPPKVDGVFITDDGDPFNENDAITQSKNVRVKIKASDATGSNGAAPSGVDQFCIVRYYYDNVARRWIETACQFAPLPALSGDGFIVNTDLPDVPGTAYAFVWVKDKAGNISRRPGFDFISFVPSTAIDLNRNDVRIFRIPLPAGQNLKLTFTPAFGDVDVSVFDDFTNPNATRIDVSANNGTTPESVIIPGSGTSGKYQIEVRAVVNSRFTISVTPVADADVAAASAAAPSQANAEPTQPTVAGPPAQQAAIEDDSEQNTTQGIFLPLVRK
ncbi:hypothetical protein BH10CHL1_BH10CHL1_33500 [soil metagenome]